MNGSGGDASGAPAGTHTIRDQPVEQGAIRDYGLAEVFCRCLATCRFRVDGVRGAVVLHDVGVVD
jgi:hypothetical protein